MNTNLNLANEIIAKQKQKINNKYVIIELGANTKVATTLKQIPGASSIEFLSASLYDKDTQVWKDSGHRSVSLNFINAGLTYYKSEYPDQNIFINSFQTEESNDKAVTHGWFGVVHNNEKTIMHATIPEHLDRISYQELIGNIGLQLITQCLDSEFTITTPYIDQVYEGEQQSIQKTIDLMQKESVVCINESGQLCRIEDITRINYGYQPLIIYKGSFDPPHKGHLYIMKTVQKKYPNHKALFSISVDNYDKGTISSGEIEHRIQMLNTLGYPVILFGSGFFKDNLTRIRDKNQQQIVFPVGSDTAERIFNSYTDTQQMVHDFENVHFESFGRDSSSFMLDEYPELISHNSENPYADVSSTNVRKDINTYIDTIPQEIHNLIKKKFIPAE